MTKLVPIHDPLENKQPPLRIPNLTEWIKVKDRGALIPIGEVYRSADGSLFMRTGDIDEIRKEATLSIDLYNRRFPVPHVTEVGELAKGIGYFTETSAGESTFGDTFRHEFKEDGQISSQSFELFCSVTEQFLTAQIARENRQTDDSRLRNLINIENVYEENPDLNPEIFGRALAKARDRTVGLPLVLTHGDFNAFNVMEGGVIDFEHLSVAPVGYDVLPSLIYQYFFDFPDVEGRSTVNQTENPEAPAQLAVCGLQY